MLSLWFFRFAIKHSSWLYFRQTLSRESLSWRHREFDGKWSGRHDPTVFPCLLLSLVPKARSRSCKCNLSQRMWCMKVKSGSKVPKSPVSSPRASRQPRLQEIAWGFYWSALLRVSGLLVGSSNISEVEIAWICRQYITPKRLYPYTKPQGITFHKTSLFVLKNHTKSKNELWPNGGF